MRDEYVKMFSEQMAAAGLGRSSLMLGECVAADAYTSQSDFSPLREVPVVQSNNSLSPLLNQPAAQS